MFLWGDPEKGGIGRRHFYECDFRFCLTSIRQWCSCVFHMHKLLISKVPVPLGRASAVREHVLVFLREKMLSGETLNPLVLLLGVGEFAL